MRKHSGAATGLNRKRRAGGEAGVDVRFEMTGEIPAAALEGLTMRPALATSDADAEQR